MSNSAHIAILTQEVIEALQPHTGGRYIDGTLGGGTHSEELLKASAPDGRMLSFELDPATLSRARKKLAPYKQRWQGLEENFRHLARAAKARDFIPCDGIVLDLGLSSDALTDPNKGLSFQLEGPLDMRFGEKANESGLTAAQIVNSWKESEIAELLRDYGEERYAKQIAKAIVAARRRERITRTSQLVAIIQSAVPREYERGRINSATRTFQALRMAVNDELDALKDAIQGAREILRPGGRIAIITFHSLEDRLVKNAFRDADDLSVITKKPLTPSQTEITKNPRARSAKLRVAEKRSFDSATLRSG